VLVPDRFTGEHKAVPHLTIKAVFRDFPEVSRQT